MSVILKLNDNPVLTPEIQKSFYFILFVLKILIKLYYEIFARNNLPVRDHTYCSKRTKNAVIQRNNDLDLAYLEAQKLVFVVPLP